MVDAFARDLINGTRLVSLRSDRISAGWGKNHQAVRLANRAFEVHFRAMRYLNSILLMDPEQDAYDKLLKSIKTARIEGWGWGVDDLQDGFQHYADCFPKLDWSDDTTEQYYVKKSYGMFDANVRGPKCCVNFLDAIESQAKSSASSFVMMSSVMHEAKNASDGGDWESFRAASTEIQKLEAKIKPWMFLAPTTVKNSTGRIFKYTDAFEKIFDVATRYADLRYGKNRNSADAAGLIILQEAASVLPILGGFYSGAIGIFVNLDADLFWKKHHERIQDRIIREGGGRF